MNLKNKIFLGFLYILSTTTNPITKTFIQQFLPENPIILEAGAYNGKDTQIMASMWPKSIIYSFEPIPNLFKKLQKRTYELKNVHRFECALSDTNGTAKFYVSGGQGAGSSSLLKPKEHITFHPGISFDSTIEVETITLDDWAMANNIDHIDFMWLDMQGAEYQMLKTSKIILPTVKVIFTEVSLLQMYEDCPLYPEFRAWLESEGFEVVAEQLPWKDMGNVLFIRKP